MTSSPHDPSDPHILVVIYTPDSKTLGRQHPLGPAPAVTTVGRRLDNDIVLDSDTASRRHARFEPRADGWWVVDEGSSHGTLVNDERVESALLRPYDLIRIGDTILKFYLAAHYRVIVESVYTPTSIDGLTKAYNRRHLIEEIDRELQPERRALRPLTLVLFDLDRFKNFNQTHGYMAGDEVLRAIVSLTRPHLRPDEVLARHAGQVFALWLPGTDRERAVERVEALRAEVAAHAFTFEEQTMSLTISAGVVQADEFIWSADELIRAADELVYAAKRGGRDRVCS